MKTFHPFFLCCVQTDSRFELHCSSDVVHIRTCSDSCAALMNLIQYIASYGDLHAANKAEVKAGAPQRKTTVQSATPFIRTNSLCPIPSSRMTCLHQQGLHDRHKAEKKRKIIYLFATFRGWGFHGLFWKIDIVCFRTLLIFSTNMTLFFNLLLSSVLGRERKHLSCKSLLYASMSKVLWENRLLPGDMQHLHNISCVCYTGNGVAV